MSGFTDQFGSAITVDKIRDWLFNGQCFAAVYTQTIGGSAAGNFALSIFNPANSKKNILVFSNKIVANNYTTMGGLFLNTSDPAYDTTITPANLKAGASTTSVASVTANSSTVSWPSSTNIDTSLSTPEMLFNDAAILLPPGNGFVAVTYVGDSQEYALSAKWTEFV